MNKALLTGRLTKPVELRKTQSGKAVTRFTLAVNRQQKDTADFINCLAWEKSAEYLNSYAGKGDLIELEGRLQVSTYDNPKTAKREYITEVVADRVSILMHKQGAPVASDTAPLPEEPPMMLDDGLPF